MFFLALSEVGAEGNPEDTRALLGRFPAELPLCPDVESASAFRSLNPGEVHRPVVLACIAPSLMGLKGKLKINGIQRVAFQTNRRQTVAFSVTDQVYSLIKKMRST